MITEIVKKGRQFHNLLGIGIVMRSIDKRQFQPVKMLCHRLIGDQHKIFDDLSCHIPLIWLYLCRMSICIKYDLAFREIEIDGSSLMSFGPQDGG